MKYINIQKVSIKNFLSVGNEPVDIKFRTGLNVITGRNKDKLDRRNGVGKSTVADAIHFAIFGTTLRELKRENIINNTNQKNCEVTLEFDVNDNGNQDQYKIIRKLAPSKCFLYKNDEDITRDSIQNTSEYIVNVLNTNTDVFQNCVIMTINNATPFMAKKKAEKRKFIEGIFNLQVFSDMLSKARQEYNTVSRELDIECAKYEEVSTGLNTHIEQRQTRDEERARSVAKLKQRKETNLGITRELEKNIKELQLNDIKDPTSKINMLTETITEVNDKIHKISNKNTRCQTLINVNSAKIVKLGTESNVCPVCLHEIDENHRHIINEEKSSIQKEIDDLNVEQNKYTTALASAKKLMSQLASEKERLQDRIKASAVQAQKITSLNERLKQLKLADQDIEEDLQHLNRNDNSVDKIIKEYEERLKVTQNKIDVIKKQMSKLDIIKFVVSEEGVKSYIVKKMLQLFNSKLSHYLKKMDSNCVCVFNEYFEEEIIDEKGKLCSYFNFSGAERKNIDLACLFAFMDIRRMQGDVAFNISMYDELFDSSLDERGVELVIDILKERIEQHNECVVVISHRKESTKLATGDIIFLEKQNSITTRVETPENELK